MDGSRCCFSVYGSKEVVLFLSRRESERGGVRGEAEEDPWVSQHPSSQPPAPGPPQQTPGPGQPAQPVRSPSAGTNLFRGRLQAVSSQVPASESNCSVSVQLFVHKKINTSAFVSNQCYLDLNSDRGAACVMSHLFLQAQLRFTCDASHSQDGRRQDDDFRTCYWRVSVHAVSQIFHDKNRFMSRTPV